MNNEKMLSLGNKLPNDSSFLIKTIDVINRLTLLLNNIGHHVSMIILFVLMFLTAADIFGRFFLNKPITGTFELTGILLSIIIFYSLGKLQCEDKHISIDFVANKLPEKFQRILQLIISIILFIFLLLVTWQVFELMKRMEASNSISGDLGIPMFIVVSLVGIGVLLYTLSYFTQICKDFLKVVIK